MAWPSGASTSVTCTASSRVGTSTSACGCPAGAGPRARTRSSSGSPNASVLPDPVFALPQTSRPASPSASASCWKAKGSTIPRSLSAPTRSAESPRSANVWPTTTATLPARPRGLVVRELSAVRDDGATARDEHRAGARPGCGEVGHVADAVARPGGTGRRIEAVPHLVTDVDGPNQAAGDDGRSRVELRPIPHDVHEVVGDLHRVQAVAAGDVDAPAGVRGAAERRAADLLVRELAAHATEPVRVE